MRNGESLSSGQHFEVFLLKLVLGRDERLSAGVDYPTSLFWKDLMRLYPNAKVTMTTLVSCTSCPGSPK